MFCSWIQSFQLSLSEHTEQAGGVEDADKGDSRCSSPVWLQADPCASPARGMEGKSQACVSHLLRGGLEPSVKETQETGHGGSSREA